MIRSCIQEHGHPPVWRCSQENGSDQCRSYFIKEKYIDRAFCEAYADLDIKTLEKQARRRDESIAQTARVALEMKAELLWIEKVEYYQLDALVERMGFQKWDTMVIEWTFGLKSKVNIRYLKERDIPNHEEQLVSVGSKSLSRLENRQVGRHSPTAFERTNVYGYDSIVGPSDDREE